MTRASVLNRLYTLLFAVLVPFLLMRIFWRGRHNRAHWRRWQERVGFYRPREHGRRVVWIHAVSVGESVAAVPLIRALDAEYAHIEVVVTTTTLTGADSVERMLGSSVEHVYFPYDLPWILRRFIAHFSPSLLVVLETELWPNTVEVCRRQGIPVLLVNARLSQRSLHAYRIVAPLMRRLVASLSSIAAQTAADAARFEQLGAATAIIHVTGSLKFDLELPASLHERAEALRRQLGVNRPLLMLGSTREGEELILFPAIRQLKTQFADLLVVLAPRHPERFTAVADACVGAGFSVTSLSSGAPCLASTDIYLVDSMGELSRFYAASDVAFVGGSLLPFGGHNVLEPASLGRPVISGPYTYNFAEICQLLSDAGVLKVARDAAAVAEVAAQWLADSNERDRVGQLGRDIVRRHGGASRRTLDLIGRYLPAPP